jgi:hypothetical protein
MNSKTLNRRSFLGRVTGGALAASGALVLVAGPGSGHATDRDPTDPATHVIWPPSPSRPHTGLTDQDRGDAAGFGNGAPAYTGVTDRDATDPRGRGHFATPNSPYTRYTRHSTGATDNDPSDPINYGSGSSRQSREQGGR